MNANKSDQPPSPAAPDLHRRERERAEAAERERDAARAETWQAAAQMAREMAGEPVTDPYMAGWYRGLDVCAKKMAQRARGGTDSKVRIAADVARIMAEPDQPPAPSPSAGTPPVAMDDEALSRARVTCDDAPESYTEQEAEAWATGYNLALCRHVPTLQTGTPPVGETPRQGVVCVKGCGYYLPACPQCDTQMVPPVGEGALDDEPRLARVLRRIAKGTRLSSLDVPLLEDAAGEIIRLRAALAQAERDRDRARESLRIRARDSVQVEGELAARAEQAEQRAAAELSRLRAQVTALEEQRSAMHRRAQKAEALNLHARSALHALRHLGKACLAEVSAADRDALCRADAEWRKRAEAAEQRAAAARAEAFREAEVMARECWTNLTVLADELAARAAQEGA